MGWQKADRLAEGRQVDGRKLGWQNVDRAGRRRTGRQEADRLARGR